MNEILENKQYAPQKIKENANPVKNGISSNQKCAAFTYILWHIN
jgi:hypothetical protein